MIIDRTKRRQVPYPTCFSFLWLKSATSTNPNDKKKQNKKKNPGASPHKTIDKIYKGLLVEEELKLERSVHEVPLRVLIIPWNSQELP